MPRRSASYIASSLWRDAIGALHVFKRNGERAVHKPLLTLMLLRQAALGESRVLSYREIEEPLARLLKEFGPSGRRPRPDYPFWHLQTDGIWVVRDAESIPLRKSGSNPRVTVLRDRDVAGEVPQELWDAVLNDERLREELIDQVLFDFWPETLHASIRAAIGLPDLGVRGGRERARRDPKFRREILRAYEYQCAVCGYDGRLDDEVLALEAAHIRWHCEGGPDEIDNGLALCSFHHNAFDRGGFGLDPAGRILISRSLHGGEAVTRWLGQFAGASFRGPQTGLPPPAERHLTWHREQVFRAPARGIA